MAEHGKAAIRLLRTQRSKPVAPGGRAQRVERRGRIGKDGKYIPADRDSMRAQGRHRMPQVEALRLTDWIVDRLRKNQWQAVHSRIVELMTREKPTETDADDLASFQRVSIPCSRHPEPGIMARLLTVHMETGQWQQIARAWEYGLTIERMPDCERGDYDRR